MQQKQELAKLFFREFEKIAQEQGLYPQKIRHLDDLLVKLIAELCKMERMNLHSHDLRLAFLSEQFSLSKAQQWRLNLLHRRAKRAAAGADMQERDYLNSLKTACFAVAALCKSKIPESLQRAIPEEDEEDASYKKRLEQVGETIAFMRVLVLAVNRKEKTLKVRDSQDAFCEELTVRYDEKGYNDKFTRSLALLERDFAGVACLHLLDVRINAAGEYLPQSIILEPDYLFDVTSIARCFEGTEISVGSYILKKLTPTVASWQMTLGNVANNFLDILLSFEASFLSWEEAHKKGQAEEKDCPKAPSFEEAFKGVFQEDPWTIIGYSDEEVRNMYTQAKKHYRHIQKVLRQDFPQHGIDVLKAIVEPSFYSQKYGLQGRLDLWQAPEPDTATAAIIVELKSGSIFRPNGYGIKHEHYIQTVLYDLLVQSVYALDKEPMKYIFYSRLEDGSNLRFAPSRREYIEEALVMRNYAVCIERHLADFDKSGLDKELFINQLAANDPIFGNKFSKQDFDAWTETWKKSSELEKRYYKAFMSFIAKENQRARLGQMGRQERNGSASLWLNSYQEKEEQFEILHDLRIESIDTERRTPHIQLKRSQQTNRLANFRQGETIVLYPNQSEEETVLQHQIFKGFIGSINSKYVQVILNSPQVSSDIFQNFRSWRIERSSSDSSYQALYKSLYRFLEAPKEKRDLLLGLRKPRFDAPQERSYANAQLNSRQRRILDKALAAKDYFMLLGPPGTGKTKFMLAEMVRYLLDNPSKEGKPENILLLGFTNRSVDEMCEAISDFAKGHFLRIGNRYSCDPRFEAQLFDSKMEDVNSRAEMQEVLKQHSVILSTVSSFASKADILARLKPFDTVIIDEASQLLEPQIIGLLPAFARFIMIGDHKQLPAVVLQDEEESAIDDEYLKTISLTNRRNALFERLYRRAELEGWTEAYDSLCHQGRMHADIAEFPAQVFYQGQLQLLDSDFGAWQKEPLQYKLGKEASPLDTLLATKRFLYFPTPADYAGAKSETQKSNPKTNRHEAKLLAQLVQSFARIYAWQGKSLGAEDLGIITPFRAQIALIRQELEALGQGFEECSIDTVERYQGGARDIILISTTVNTNWQLQGIVSRSQDEPPIDRKLNVALTRARQHLILVGNKETLQEDSSYAALLDYLAERGREICL